MVAMASRSLGQALATLLIARHLSPIAERGFRHLSNSPDGSRLGSEDAQIIWDALAERVEAFVVAWQSGAPPNVEDFAPSEPPTVRRLTLVELIKIDMEHRWQVGGSPRWIEEYVRLLPELADTDGPPADLIYEEFHLRRQRGDAVNPPEYLDRFPGRADPLRRLFGLGAPEHSTALFSGGPLETIEPGERLDDFDLLTRLGKGAFATVFLARQCSMQRLVALKVSANRGREAETLAQLDHPNIVRVYDQRVLSDRKLRLLYMQYVAGGTLADSIERIRTAMPADRSGKLLLEAIDAELEKRGETPPHESLSRARLASAAWPEAVCIIGTQLASALGYAHGRGVLHRDLKPANILLTAEGDPKLVDFNISFCDKLEGATPAAYFGGSLAYMSPEQIEACSVQHERNAASLDQRSDVYSLAVVLWELLTGRRPFDDTGLNDHWSGMLDELVRQRRAGVPASAVHALPASCPRGLREILLKCLAPDPDDRYASAKEVARQLRLCLQPYARQLLRPSTGNWTHLARRAPILTVMIAGLPPNAVSGWFNYVYNKRIVDRLVDDFPQADDIFWNVQGIMNGIFFPLGFLLTIVLTLPIGRALKAKHAARPAEGDLLAKARLRCLKLGHYAALICIVLWLIAGVAYPVALRYSGVPLTTQDSLHFIVSLALCGLIVAAYPFFFITFATVRGFYTSLIHGDPSAAEDVPRLAWLHRLTWPYLVLAASLPMLGVALLVVLDSAPNRLALGVLSAVGLLGFAVIFRLARTIQNDAAALADVVRSPGDSSLVETSSFSATIT